MPDIGFSDGDYELRKRYLQRGAELFSRSVVSTNILLFTAGQIIRENEIFGFASSIV
jgi:hypothetical protein